MDAFHYGIWNYILHDYGSGDFVFYAKNTWLAEHDLMCYFFVSEFCCFK